MPSPLRTPDFVESPPYANTSRISRLQQIVCVGALSGDSNLAALAWVKDNTKPGGGYWVAWDEPSPLP